MGSQHIQNFRYEWEKFYLKDFNRGNFTQTPFMREEQGYNIKEN